MAYREVPEFLAELLLVISARAIWIIVRQVRSDNQFEDWRPAGAAIMFETFESIHWRTFSPINFLSKSE